MWGYDLNGRNGDIIMNWITLNNMELIYNAKEKGTFHSVRWQKDYSPDLCILTRKSMTDNTTATRTVLDNFPHSQHRPVLIDYGLQIPIVRSISKPRWNFKLAKWDEYAKDLDKIVKWIPPISCNYDRFCKAIKKTAEKHIPRGYRKTYIPGWDVACKKLFEEYEESHDSDIADDLIRALNDNRKKRWQETTENLSFIHSSRKGWALLKKLGSENVGKLETGIVTPNNVASRLIKVGKIEMDKSHTREVKRKLRKEMKILQVNEEYIAPFSQLEIVEALKKVKINKAAGFDGIYPEMLKKYWN